jgi:hypothetical protein
MCGRFVDDLLCMCEELCNVWHLQLILQEQIRHMWEARRPNEATAKAASDAAGVPWLASWPCCLM